MFPIIEIGPLAVQAAGLILILSIWIGIWITGKFAKSLGTNGEVLENCILLGLLVGIIGARVGFFLQNPEALIAKPLNLFALSPTMLNTSFGLLTGGLTALIIAQRNHLPLWPTLDTLSPLIIFVFIGLHMANLANGDQFGLPTRLSWGITLWGANRHPVQIYGLLLGIGLLVWFFVKTSRLTQTGFLKSGLLFFSSITGISLITVFTRAFVEQKLLIGVIDIIQLISVIIMIASLISFYKRHFQPQNHIGVYVSVGSNLNPQENLTLAYEQISSLFKVRRSSSIYRTKNVKAGEKTADFLNQVIEIETGDAFPKLVKQLKTIEQNLKRIPGNKREVSLDLDVLTYDGHAFKYRTMIIPDPDIEKYRYIGEPLFEIAPDFRHPASGRSIQQILENSKDQTKIIKLEEVENGS